MTHTQESTPAFEPGPFCGADETKFSLIENIGKGYQVECMSCHCTSSIEVDGPALIAAWNRRTPPASQSDEALVDYTPDEIEFIQKLMDRYSEGGGYIDLGLDHPQFMQIVRRYVSAREASARAEGRREGIEEAAVWLLDEGTRLDYDAEPSPKEHPFWWAADKLRALKEKQP